jgi:hypothetical protein
MFGKLSSLSQAAWAIFKALSLQRQVVFGFGISSTVSLIPSERILAEFILRRVPRNLWPQLLERIRILDSIDVNYITSKIKSELESLKGKSSARN